MRVIRHISRGGFGTVDEVEDGGRRLARKSFAPQTRSSDEREKLAKRFSREVRIQSQIQHPHIMPVVSSDLSGAPPSFTMPLAQATFEAKLAADRTASTFDPLPWQDILAAVEELHRLGFVHRDLKPANILEVDGRWVLSDFGLILPTARDTTVLTSSQSAYGSHFYAAPEQATDFRNTPAQADIFALGCILHDATDPAPRRIPFAQIRATGPYAPILEKATEVDHARRFPTISALRAALFDLWRTSHFAPAQTSDESVLSAVMTRPNDRDAWRALVVHLENAAKDSQDALLRGVTEDLIGKVAALDDLLFSRLMSTMCGWAAGKPFDFTYCDVVGDRLVRAYGVATTNVKVTIVLAALELGVSHNRWHVMSQVGAMLSLAAETGFIDRMVIELSLDRQLIAKLHTIERVIKWPRSKWHSKIASAL